MSENNIDRDSSRGGINMFGQFYPFPPVAVMEPIAHRTTEELIYELNRVDTCDLRRREIRDELDDREREQYEIDSNDKHYDM